jgi:hypothetical protein
MCANNSDRFGCKSTIESVQEWGWILCID